ncbi:DHRS7B [Bugula neritina]|uniref:DHRS7B n=1 Tax=Bugula neritina TaxID=10212 RepID=A0A7J7KJ27_BUGNE|nr:DHRS7B [Bugula neritina]
MGFICIRYSIDGASKHALQAFFDSLRHENVKNGIDVLVVSPGYVKTNLAQSSLTGTGERSGVQLLLSDSLHVTNKWLRLLVFEKIICISVAQTKEIDNGMSPETCAKAVLKAIINYDTDLLIGRFHHKLVVYIRNLCPSLYNYIMSRL